jgi:hypothetical protein
MLEILHKDSDAYRQALQPTRFACLQIDNLKISKPAFSFFLRFAFLDLGTKRLENKMSTYIHVCTNVNFSINI